MRQFLLKVLSQFGVGVTSATNLANLKKDQIELWNLRSFIAFQEKLADLKFPADEKQKALKEFKYSKSQLQQDLFVLLSFKFKSGGFFVEFGATDGLNLSNTYMLEKNFGWKGILAEPARSWHASLRKNRSAEIETKCIWKETGKVLQFNETKVGELSTLDSFSNQDMHAYSREDGIKYTVETISLFDLLVECGAPEFIDYLSIDTEGSEFEILENFDFDAYSFGFISCEHNFTENRDKIFNLLSRQGYVRVFEKYSQFDDWYLHKSLVKA
jgi:FkbM family methyltransferase